MCTDPSAAIEGLRDPQITVSIKHTLNPFRRIFGRIWKPTSPYSCLAVTLYISLMIISSPPLHILLLRLPMSCSACTKVPVLFSCLPSGWESCSHILLMPGWHCMWWYLLLQAASGLTSVIRLLLTAQHRGNSQRFCAHSLYLLPQTAP